MPTPPAGTTVEEGIVLAGLVGRGIGLSRSPVMHETEGRAQGLDYSYVLFDMDAPGQAGRGLADVVAAAQARGRARDLETTVKELLAELGDP